MKTLGTTAEPVMCTKQYHNKHTNTVTDFEVSLCFVKSFLKNNNIKILTQNQKSTTVLPR